jgi:hypothetical protein
MEGTKRGKIMEKVKTKRKDYCYAKFYSRKE